MTLTLMTLTLMTLTLMTLPLMTLTCADSGGVRTRRRPAAASEGEANPDRLKAYSNWGRVRVRVRGRGRV